MVLVALRVEVDHHFLYKALHRGLAAGNRGALLPAALVALYHLDNKVSNRFQLDEK